MKRALVAFSIIVLACAPQVRPTAVSGFALKTVAGAPFVLGASVEQSPFTVFEFFSADCPVQKAHDQRLIELYRRYQTQGVQFFAVDSEMGASTEHAVQEKRKRGYPFPMLIDEQSRFADSLGASYSTFSIVVDRTGTIRYQGGIDSDRVRPRPDSTPYLQNALDDLLAGRAPRQAVGNVYGCMLRKW